MIYVECKADRALVKFLTSVERRHIGHEGGKSRVCRKLAERGNCKGLVDEDPSSAQPPYMQKVKLETYLEQEKLKAFLDESNGNHLFVLCPNLEEWVLKAARDAKLETGKYPLPNNPEQLHKVINLNLDKLERLLEDLKDKDSKRLKALKKLLES